MELYIKNKKLLIKINGKAYHAQLAKSTEPLRLFSADKCILKDKNGIYVLPKEVNS